MKNGDAIRAMSDEDLAEFIAFHDCCPDGWQIEDARCKQSKGCAECWLEWLKQSAEGR